MSGETSVKQVAYKKCRRPIFKIPFCMGWHAYKENAKRSGPKLIQVLPLSLSDSQPGMIPLTPSIPHPHIPNWDGGGRPMPCFPLYQHQCTVKCLRWLFLVLYFFILQYDCLGPTCMSTLPNPDTLLLLFFADGYFQTSSAVETPLILMAGWVGREQWVTADGGCTT